MAINYLVQESDGVSRIIKEDGSGFIILESSDSGGGAGGSNIYIPTFRPRRRSARITLEDTNGHSNPTEN
jgi:hypothetical protein